MHISSLARPGLYRHGENINKYIIHDKIALLITYICMHTLYILYRPAYITYIHLSVSSMHANILHMPRPLSLLWPASGNYLPTRNSWKWHNHHLISTIVVKSALLCIESCFYIQVLLRRSYISVRVRPVDWVLTIVPYVGVLTNICDICTSLIAMKVTTASTMWSFTPAMHLNSSIPSPHTCIRMVDSDLA